MTDIDQTSAEPPAETAPQPPLEHVVVENETVPDECVVFPADATEAELRTRWLITDENGFVALESMR